jgi:hypothetical protein
MEAVTGYVEIRSEKIAEVVEFVKSHSDDLNGKRIGITWSEPDRLYKAYLCSTVEPI